MTSSATLLTWSRFGFCASRTTSSSCRVLVRPACSRSWSSGVKVRSYLQYVKRKLRPPPTPPYSHVCQVGDPVLRCRAAAVDPAAIAGPEIQRVLVTMVTVMRRLQCVGLSAPQVGVPLRILMLEYPWNLFEAVPPAARQALGLSIQPLRIFLNPELRVLDGSTVLSQEACESVSGFSAAVPRFRSVEVSGLNENGQEVTWQASGWPARILQHEMDHLDGVLFLDRMDSRTFININWQEHNE
ncbi:peptide deformylase, mitochondrial [Poecilia latipinna]|uniref:Peptide deformylase n=2 Tax=Poecilia TaxID=8080 RepID=A0A087Y1H9_POEFO|nr:PREDICTED: peptide deformylase, mitochondrial [Poecilia formosa]XP_014879996.1 PREDICTED: peptide deformylase, mitochondrial [Poecilia latipinna]XP_014879997.1 PREDICTED: peptide deformylase, mitochondrial [Poecilia latipinna]XP_014879998.1 PREDICTED: peptide deformylase, mitochondrial [Poecilia latipinna]XP_016520421.1 PREDICTED: peptide deformylase, mitochondrial [Poecilia formosa]XP_016520422.1 PREDICTED: peptide deformylase, mitochondrial [Poecilia formosa]